MKLPPGQPIFDDLGRLTGFSGVGSLPDDLDYENQGNVIDKTAQGISRLMSQQSRMIAPSVVGQRGYAPKKTDMFHNTQPLPDGRVMLNPTRVQGDFEPIPQMNFADPKMEAIRLLSEYYRNTADQQIALGYKPKKNSLIEYIQSFIR